MSFASSVKEELFKHIGTSRHCRLAELAALIDLGSETSISGADTDTADGGAYVLRIEFDNKLTAEKCFTLLAKTFNISKNAEDVLLIEGTKVTLKDPEEIRMFKQAVSSDILLQKSCCQPVPELLF